MKILSKAYTFDDVLLVPQHSSVKSRKEPNTSSAIGKQDLRIPVISSPMNTITEHKMATAMIEIGADAVLHRYMTIENERKEFELSVGPYKPWVAIGASGDFLERAQELYKTGARKFCIDVANGHSNICLDAVRKLRENFGDCISIMAGNVCTGDGAANLENAGADVIRCGIGCGSVCLTRLVTGHGVPQLTAIDWCAKAVKNAHIIADGGIRKESDLIKALAAGAHAVMVGGTIAGSDQTPGETEKDPETGRLYKWFRGMASLQGRQEWFGREVSSFVPEGGSSKVWHSGDAKKIVAKFNDSLKVGMSFSNALTLTELRLNARFVEISFSGYVEGTHNKKMFK